MDVSRVAGERGNVSHTGIHIGGAHGVSDSLVLFDDRLVALRVFRPHLCLATVVEEELRLIEILALASDEIEFAKCHLGDLMSRHHAGLSRFGSHLTDDTVGVAYGDVKEVAASRGLIVCDGSLYHMSEVIELVAEILFFRPPLVASPLMRMLRVLCSGSIEITVGLLRTADDRDHAVDIVSQFGVGIGLENIAGSLNGLVGIGVVEAASRDGKDL